MPPPIPYAPRNAQFVCDPADFAKAIKPNADGSVNVVILSGTVIVTPVAAGTATDKSFTTSGAAATVIAANANRLGWGIDNPVASALNANADPIYVRLGATAAADGTSFEVPAGQSFPPPSFPLYTGLISVIGATGIKCPAVELTA